MLKAIVVTAIGSTAPSYAQVRVITADVEHIYGSEGEILDDPQFRAKNQRARQTRGDQGGAGPASNKACLSKQSGPRRAPDS